MEDANPEDMVPEIYLRTAPFFWIRLCLTSLSGRFPSGGGQPWKPTRERAAMARTSASARMGAVIPMRLHLHVGINVRDLL
jgi:hypothetical protein